jgi:hypothetical protein
MTTFDQILPNVTEVLRKHKASLSAIEPLFINRDLNGRVRLVANESVRTDEQARQTLASIARALQERLGYHAHPVENTILFEADMDVACAGASVFPLEGFETVSIIDRLATEGDWASIAPGNPRGTGQPLRLLARQGRGHRTGGWSQAGVYRFDE